MKKLRRKIVLVKWYDAWIANGWKDADDFRKSDKGYACQSVGIIMFEDKISIRLAQSVSDENDTCAAIITIPKAWLEGKPIKIGEVPGNFTT